MNWKTVESSNISAMGHDGVTMAVTFKSGVTYAYDNVERHVFDEIVSSDSIGGSFNTLVRKNPERYPYRRI